MKPSKTDRKKAARAAAVVDIGSNLLRMRICQQKQGEIWELEYLEYPISIGHEVFTSGKISFESIRAISSALQSFFDLAREYGAEICRVVTTTCLLYTSCICWARRTCILKCRLRRWSTPFGER